MISKRKFSTLLPQPNLAEDIQAEMLFEAFDILPPFNVAQKVEDMIQEHGENAAHRAQEAAAFARAYGEPDIADDYELVKKSILFRQQQDSH